MTLEEAMALTIDEPKETKTTKYKAIAYLERCLRGAIDGLDTDDEAILNEFVQTNCQLGLTCEVIDVEVGARRVFYAETETDDLLEDLRLEQQEQM